MSNLPQQRQPLPPLKAQLDRILRPGIQSFSRGFAEVRLAINELKRTGHRLSWVVVEDGRGTERDITVEHSWSCMVCRQ